MFLENLGQWDPRVRFRAQGDATVWIAEDGVWIDAYRGDPRGEHERLALRFLTSASFAAIEGRDRVSTGFHFFVGNDSERWASDVSAFRQVVVHEAWPGVDIVLGERPDTLVAYDLHVSPGVDLAGVEVSVDGATRLVVEPDGSLRIETASGTFRQTPPVTWEKLPDGSTRRVPSRFEVRGEDGFGFLVDGRIPSRPLVIDPGIQFGTYLGGQFDDAARAGGYVDVDASVVVAGWTISSEFPKTHGQSLIGESSQIFVSRLSPDLSQLLTSSIVGGDLGDTPRDIARSPSGRIIVVGATGSPNFPIVTPAADHSLGGEVDGFVLELSGAGDSLTASTYLGGSDDDHLRCVDIAANGDVVVAGLTSSEDLPGTGGAFRSSLALSGWEDGWVGRLTPDLSTLEWATYFGGIHDDEIFDLEVAACGAIVLAGTTRSVDFPTTPGAYQTVAASSTPNLGSALFASILAPDGATLQASTIVDLDKGEQARQVAVSGDGRVAVCGDSNSPDYPVSPGSYDQTFGPFSSAFLTIFDQSLSSIEASTFLGVEDSILPGYLGWDESGVFTIIGCGDSDDLSVTPGAPIPVGYNDDPLLLRMRPDLSDMLYAAALGTNMTFEVGGAEAADGTAFVIWTSQDPAEFGMPEGAYDPSWNGDGPVNNYGDAAIVRYELQPAGVTSFGVSTHGCNGSLRLTALASPQVGGPPFAIACTGAPKSGAGFFAIGAALPLGLPVAGITAFLDPSAPFALVGASADALGQADVALPIPATAAGAQVAVQSVWIEAACPSVSGILSASDALLLSVF